MADESIFNLEHTSEVAALCDVPSEDRDGAWQSAFFSVIATASFSCNDPQVILGPDGFPYFGLNLPTPHTEFECYSIAHLLEFLTTEGIGVVINPLAEGGPDWVFSYGDIWNYRETGEFIPKAPRYDNPQAENGVGPKEDKDGSDVEIGDAAAANAEILISYPSEQMLPTYVRQAISSGLVHNFKIKTPSAFMIFDSELNPAQNLVFNIFAEDFENKADLESAQNFVLWSLPRDYGVVGIERGSSLSESFEPLVTG